MTEEESNEKFVEHAKEEYVRPAPSGTARWARRLAARTAKAWKASVIREVKKSYKNLSPRASLETCAEARRNLKDWARRRQVKSHGVEMTIQSRLTLGAAKFVLAGSGWKKSCDPESLWMD